MDNAGKAPVGDNRRMLAQTQNRYDMGDKPGRNFLLIRRHVHRARHLSSYRTTSVDEFKPMQTIAFISLLMAIAVGLAIFVH